MKFRCNCGQTLNASAELIGEEIACPACDASVQVPDPAALVAKAEELERAKAHRKKKAKKARPSGVAAVFNQVCDIGMEVLATTLQYRNSGFIFGPLLLLVFAAFYLKPIALTEERVQKIQRGMTLKQVEAIIGTTHKKYRDPRPEHFNRNGDLVDYSKIRRPYDDNHASFNARLWHDGWFVTGNNAMHSVFIEFQSDVVFDIRWK